MINYTEGARLWNAYRNVGDPRWVDLTPRERAGLIALEASFLEEREAILNRAANAKGGDDGR